MNYTEHHYTSFDDLPLYYRAYGAGDDVVLCLPGLTRNSNDFTGIANHLSDRWRVITPDLRGRGQSAWDPDWRQYTPLTYVRDAFTLMDSLRVERWVNLGTSLGGLMTMLMAAERPRCLRGAILNDVGPEITPEALERIASYVGSTPAQPDWATAAKMAEKNYALAYPDADETFWMQQARAAWRERDDGMLEPAYDPAIGNAFRESVKSLARWRLLRKFGLGPKQPKALQFWDQFRQLTMPALLLRGELSDVISPEIVRRMQAEKADLEFLSVPRVGHVPTLVEPESKRAIDTFLSRLPPV